jgi:hypothetical protein
MKNPKRALCAVVGRAVIPAPRALLAGCLLMAAIPAAKAATYYVDSVSGSDSNNGTSTSTPWRTIPHVNGKVFQPGDQILFKRGSVWTGRLTPKGSGVNGNPIVVGAYGTGAKPVINGGGATQAVALWDNSYVTIRDLEITNDAPNVGVRDGIRVTAKNGIQRGIKILNNDIHDVHGTSDRNGSLYHNAAIYFVTEDTGSGGGFADILVEGNTVYDVTCIGLYTKPASYHTPQSGLLTTNLVIRNNLFDRTGADHIVVGGAVNPLIEHNAGYDAGALGANYGYAAGIWPWKCDGSTIQFNEVARTQNELAVANLGDGQAFDVDLSTFGVHILQYNYSHDNVGGILLTMPDHGENPPEKTVIFRYNISVNDGRDTHSGCQFNVNPNALAQTVEIYNNVIYSNLPEGFKVKDILGSHYFNNIFHVKNGIYPSNPEFSNNCYYNHLPDVVDPYKVLADPKFVGPLPTGPAGDGYSGSNFDRFKIQSSSPCINQGRTIAGNGGRDFWNNNLYAGGYADIGAHEVSGGSAPVRPAASFVDNTSSALTFGGTWSHGTENTYYNGTKSATTTNNSFVQYTFVGTNVTLFGKSGTANGRINVQVDGGPATTVDTYSPFEKYRRPLFSIAGLSSGTHTIKATLVGKNPASSSNGFGVDYFKVHPDWDYSEPTPARIDNAPGGSVVYGGSGWTGTSNVWGKTRSETSNVNNYVEFTFVGTGARLVGVRADSLGKLNVSVDGGAATTVDCYNGTVSDYEATLFEVRGLHFGTHTLRATVATKNPASSSNKVIIDYLDYFTSKVVDNTPSTSVVYSGGWTHNENDSGFYHGTKSVSSSVGQYVDFTFNGTAVAVYVKKANNQGRLNLSIDGGPVTTVNCYSASPQYLVKVGEFTGLAPGTHTLRASVATKQSPSSGNYIGIDCFTFEP